MSYDYQAEKPNVFTEDGQKMFLRIRDWLNTALTETGAARVTEIIRHAGSGGSFTMLACIDRLVELKEIQYACTCNHTGPHSFCIVERADHRFGCEKHPNE